VDGGARHPEALLLQHRVHLLQHLPRTAAGLRGPAGTGPSARARTGARTRAVVAATARRRSATEEQEADQDQEQTARESRH
jgi:hypothetical protein